MSYILTPPTIKWSGMLTKGYNMSSAIYAHFTMPNQRYQKVSDLLSHPLMRSDLGQEVGSLSYIERSPYRFIRTKALQEHTFLLTLTDETALPILPSDFVQMDLKKGDLLISKDSNIGEIVILDRDYPNHMLSGAIYKLPVKPEWRYYLLAMIKHNVFREQLDALVPKGATIRHAKTMFLDCKIPLPCSCEEETVKYISVLTQAIIDKETLIRKRHTDILHIIDDEIK